MYPCFPHRVVLGTGSLLVLWGAWAGCKVENPGFEPEVLVTTGATRSSDDSATRDPGDASSSGPVEDSTASETGEASAQSSAAQTSQTSSSALATTSSQTQSSEADPNEAAAQAYCSHGSVACYAMISLAGDQFTDRGVHGRHIPAAGLSTKPSEQASYPLPLVVLSSEAKSFSSGQGFAIPDGGIMGFDIWLRPSSHTANSWTAFDIDNYMSLKRDVLGRMKCGFKNSDTAKALYRSFSLEENRLHHFACAFDGTRKYQWIDGVVNNPSDPGDTNELPEDFPDASAYNFGWSNLADKPMAGEIGAIRVWEDIDKLKAEIARLHPGT